MTSTDDDGNDVVRRKAAELEVAAARARTVGIALNATVGALMVLAALFSAFNTYRLRQISRDIRIDAEFNQRLVQLIQIYNEEHAEAAGQSFDALNANVRCMFDWMADYNTALAESIAGKPQALPDRGLLDACYRPTTPQPAPPPKPKEKEKPG